MFGVGLGPRPTSIVDLLALANLAPGGVTNAPLPANPATGSQTPSSAMDMGVMPPARPGMFGGNGIVASQPAPQSPQEAYQRIVGSARGPMNLAGDSVENTGPLGVDQFGLGRDLANLAHVDQVKSKPYKGLFPGKDLPIILGILGDALAGAAGRPPTFGPMMQRRREAEDDHNRALELWRAKVEAERAEKMRPQIEQVGNSIGWLDPTAQSFKPFYTAPQPFEAYAMARGLTPGTPEYAEAVQDYRLGSYSDPAMEARTELENLRYQNRDALQDERLATSRRNTDARVAATRRGQNMTDSRVRRGQDLTDERVRGSAGYQGKGGKGGKGSSAGGDLIGPVYTRGKVRIQFSKSQNKYVPVR